MSELTADTAVATEVAPATETATTVAPENTQKTAESSPKAAEPSMDDALAAIYRKANPDREPDGKFAANPENAKAEIPPMPSSWAKANEEVWQSLTPAARDLVLKREADGAKGVEQLKAQYEPYKGLEKTIEPHKALLSSMGLTPIQGIERLITFHQAMMSNPQRGILEIAQNYGVNLPAMFGPQAQAQRGTGNAFLDGLVREVQSLKAEREADKQAQVKAIETDLNGQIETFSKKPDREHFEVLKPAMAQLLISGLADGLDDAYDKAARLNPDVAALIDAKAKEAEAEKVRAETAKKAASLNVKSSAANTASPKPLDDQLRGIWRKHNS